jgi:hypothetical protein
LILQGKEREDRGYGRGKTKWERIPEKVKFQLGFSYSFFNSFDPVLLRTQTLTLAGAFPTLSSLWVPFDFPVPGYWCLELGASVLPVPYGFLKLT